MNRHWSSVLPREVPLLPEEQEAPIVVLRSSLPPIEDVIWTSSQFDSNVGQLHASLVDSKKQWLCDENIVQLEKDASQPIHNKLVRFFNATAWRVLRLATPDHFIETNQSATRPCALCGSLEGGVRAHTNSFSL